MIEDQGHGAFRFGRLEIRPGEQTAMVDGNPLSLTRHELHLLTAMAVQPQRILTREQLCEHAWGRPFSHSDRSVDVYVSRLRAKLAEALPEADLIRTHAGIGYRFSPDL